LTGATYGEGIEIGQNPKQILGGYFSVFIFKTHVKIETGRQGMAYMEKGTAVHGKNTHEGGNKMQGGSIDRATDCREVYRLLKSGWCSNKSLPDWNTAPATVRSQVNGQLIDEVMYMRHIRREGKFSHWVYRIFPSDAAAHRWAAKHKPVGFKKCGRQEDE
jgi:hypothetical protein